MTAEKQRIAIAIACGWTIKHKGLWVEKLQTYAALPDYFNDLNACHQMEKVLTGKGVNAWWSYVAFVNRHNPTPFGTETAVHATAAQRCEAFLRTLGLWEEEQ
jgi:hypothetical protein